jgi:hypothetical protein
MSGVGQRRVRWLRRSQLLVAATILLAFNLISATAPLAQQNEAVQCVKRTAKAKPPPFPGTPRPRQPGKYSDQIQPEHKPTAQLGQLCPDGEVPVIKPFMAPKGNPLLRPHAALPRDRERLRFFTFEQLYRAKRGPTGGPPPPPPAPPCAGVSWYNGCFYYASAGLSRAADGGGMTISVNRPAYNGSGDQPAPSPEYGHSLDEIAVQGGTANGNIVELGWFVSPRQYADSDPHIFVYHWVNQTLTCYDDCGWQQVSSTYAPGRNISALIGNEVYVGYVFYRGNWWAWFDDQWMGYFPSSLWTNAYNKSGLIQWFGEVDSYNGVPPKAQMGNGILPPNPAAARMFTLCDVDAKAWVCWIRDQQLVGPATVPKYYDIGRVGFGDTRYGGPGQ